MRKADTKIGKFIGGAAIFVALFAFSGDVMAQSARELGNRLSRLENEIETLSRAIYRGEQPPPSSSRAGDAAGSANMEIRLQQLERQIQQLTGKVEEQSYATRKLNDALERMQGDLEMRLGDLESGGAQNGSSYGAGGTASKPRPGDVTLYNPAPSNASSGSQTMGGSETMGGTRNLGGGGNDAAAAYENAFSLLKNGNYDAAEREFETFLQNNKGHPLAGNAKYWLGETFYVRGDFDRAARIFAEGYQQYPDGAKTADNLLKLGLSLSSIGNNKDACIALNQLKKDFSTGSGPVLRRAEQEMQRLGC
ncbi:MAG: tol-pal system protein YbgF [Micavibrio sp.]|nr:tol-pal system protein YbgF [Micavibrio sp.]